MDTKPISKSCPKCQSPLPADAPQGLCPKCLFAAVATPTEAGQPAGRPAPPPIEEIAAAFPQLEILEFIGQGGMGFVFKARQPKLDRLVALKILPQSLAADPTFAERFNREARLLARLNHPGIVTVHDFGATGHQLSTPDSQPFYYLLMEFVDGVNLRQAMQAGRFTPEQALAIVPKICEALQFAHNEGILHRDIKPENILLDAKGRVKIADFGIAKLMDGRADLLVSQAAQQHRPTDANLTEAGKTLGSPNYMAPEQLDHPGEVDRRADIYSLGVVFYEMLTGELPRGRFAPPSQKSTADPRVDEVVLRALEKEKSRRYASADEVRTQVETIVTGSSGRKSARTESPAQLANQSRLTSAATSKSRFSRMAFVGACLIPLTSLVPMMVWWVRFPIQSEREVFGLSLAGVVLLIGVAAPVVTTILGWMAVSQIRRSAGKIYGLWLAVFDGLFFPLLALDAVIFGLAYLVVTLLAKLPYFSGSGDGSFGGGIAIGYQIAMLSFIWLGSGTILSLMADFFIIRRVWRAVNKAAAAPPSGIARGWLTAVVGLHGLAFLGLLAFLVFIVPRFQEVFTGFGVKLPAATMLVIFIGKIAVHGGFLLVPVVLALDITICWLLHKFAGWKLFATWAALVFFGIIAFVALSLFMLYLPVNRIANVVGGTPDSSSPQAVPNLSFGPVMPASALQFRLVVPKDSTEPTDELPGISGPERFHVLRETLLDGSAVAQAGVDFNPDGTRRIEIQFTAAGKQQFAEITGANLSRQLAMVFRGKVLSAPVIRATISGGQCQINGNLSQEEVYALLDCLNRNTTTSAQTMKFTAPRERILPFQPRPGFLVGWLDLDSGTVLTNSILDWQTHAGHEWIRSNSLDLATTVSTKEIQVLLGFDAIILAAPTNGWDTVTAVDVAYQWNLLQDEPQQMKIIGAIPDQSATYLFRTREDGMGLLQIIGFTDNPRGVKIRYKLVRNETNASTTNSPGDWIWEPNAETLNQVPPIFLLRPSTLPTNSTPFVMQGKDRCLARGQSVRDLLALSWSQADSSRKIIFDTDVPDLKFDFIAAGDSKWWYRLEGEITGRFGVFGFAEPGENGGSNVHYKLVKPSSK